MQEQPKSEFLISIETRKKEANELFKQKKFDEAYILYANLAIEVAEYQDREKYAAQVLSISETLYCNIAQALLNLGCYEESLQNCNNILEQLNKNNVKALFRKAESYFFLEKPEKSLEVIQYLETLKQTQISKKEIQKLKEKYTNYQQQLNKQPDALELMKNYAKEQEIKFEQIYDQAFNIERKDTGNMGQGIFATQDIDIGDVIIVEHPMAIAYGKKEIEQELCEVQQEQLAVECLKRAGENYQFAKKLFNLYSNFDAKMKITDSIDSEDQNSDKKSQNYMNYQFKKEKVLAIIQVNAHFFRKSSTSDTQQIDSDHQDMGLFYYLSQINHSSKPNSFSINVGDILLTIATEKIQKGEQVFQRYATPSMGFDYYASILKYHKVEDPEFIEMENSWEKKVSNLVKNQLQQLRTHLPDFMEEGQCVKFLQILDKYHRQVKMELLSYKLYYHYYEYMDMYSRLMCRAKKIEKYFKILYKLHAFNIEKFGMNKNAFDGMTEQYFNRDIHSERKDDITKTIIQYLGKNSPKENQRNVIEIIKRFRHREFAF